MSNFDMALAELLNLGKLNGTLSEDDIIEVTIKYDISTLKFESLIEMILSKNIIINENDTKKGMISLENNDNNIEGKRKTYRNVIERKIEYEEERIKLLKVSGDIVKKEFFNDFQKAKCQSTYMPVVILAFIENVEENGNADFHKIIKYFGQFYLDRKEKNLIVERSDSIFVKNNPTESEIKKLILFNPLGRSCLVKYFGYNSNSDTITINPNLWSALYASDICKIKKICYNKINSYFSSISKHTI